MNFFCRRCMCLSWYNMYGPLSSVAESFSHNPFTSASHLFTLLKLRLIIDPLCSKSIFVCRSLLSHSDDGNRKLPLLPPWKPTILQSPSKHISTHNCIDRSQSPSKLVVNPPISPSPLPPTIPSRPSHQITSTLIMQSLQATKTAQIMKKPEEQLERERVLLRSSSTTSGAHFLAGTFIINISINTSKGEVHVRLCSWGSGSRCE